MKILKKFTKKRRVRQKRQLQWQRNAHMKICMLDWKQKKVRFKVELYRLARQRDRAGKDVQHMRVIKNVYGNMMVSSEAMLKRWKEYFEKLMNKENDREPKTEEAEVINEKINCISRKEVKNTLKRIHFSSSSLY